MELASMPTNDSASMDQTNARPADNPFRPAGERYPRQCRPLGLLGFALAAALGCEARPTLVPVTGKVTMDGSPVEGAMVVFFNQDPEDKPALGMTNAQGRFSLRTHLRPNEDPEGAQPGHYDVAITKTMKVPRTPDPEIGWQSLPDKDVNLLPEKYSNRGSGLEARVKEGEPNKFAFDLDAK